APGEHRNERTSRHTTAPRATALEERTGRLDQRAVRHAGRTGGLAGSATEAEVEVAHHLRRRLQRTVLERPHETDAPARRVRLGAELDVRRACREAEPPVHAGGELLGLDEAH